MNSALPFLEDIASKESRFESFARFDSLLKVEWRISGDLRGWVVLRSC